MAEEAKVVEEKKQLTIDDWGKLPPEEQKQIIESDFDSVPESVKPAVKKSQELDENSEDSLEGVTDKRGVPVKNLVAEAVRKVKKEMKEEIDELRGSIKTPEPQVSQPAGGDYWDKQAEEIAGQLIKYDNDKGDYVVDKDVVKRIITQPIYTFQDIRGMEKRRAKEIKTLVNKYLDKDERQLYGNDIVEELDVLPVTEPITKEHIEKARLMSRGRHSDKLVEEAKRSLEKEFGKTEIVGEDTGDAGYIPGGKGSSGMSNKKPTATQIRFANERGITLTQQMELDERAAKRKKKE